jgi:hypothetical protein
MRGLWAEICTLSLWIVNRNANHYTITFDQPVDYLFLLLLLLMYEFSCHCVQLRALTCVFFLEQLIIPLSPLSWKFHGGGRGIQDGRTDCCEQGAYRRDWQFIWRPSVTSAQTVGQHRAIIRQDVPYTHEHSHPKGYWALRMSLNELTRQSGSSHPSSLRKWVKIYPELWVRDLAHHRRE